MDVNNLNEMVCQKNITDRLLLLTVDISKAMIPTATAPMTTPNTMSHGGVSYTIGVASVGGIPTNSRVMSDNRNALFMRCLLNLELWIMC